MYETKLRLRLEELAAGLLGVARDLDAQSNVATGSGESSDLRQEQRLELTVAIVRARRKRSQIFGDSDLFGEPAWDMMLDLYLAHCKGQNVSVTSACIAAAVPTSTALRWLNILQRRELVERYNDADDARRTFVKLSRRGLDRMEEYFGRLIEALPKKL